MPRSSPTVRASPSPSTANASTLSVSLSSVLHSSQLSFASHPHCVEVLDALLSSNEQELSTLLINDQIPRLLMYSKKEECVERVIVFLAQWLSSCECHDSKHRLLSSTLVSLLPHTVSKLVSVRYRACLLIGVLLSVLSVDASLDDTLLSDIQMKLIDRVTDTATTVRAAACMAMERFHSDTQIDREIETEIETTEEDNHCDHDTDSDSDATPDAACSPPVPVDDPVARLLLYMSCTDPSVLVRKSALSSVCVNHVTSELRSLFLFRLSDVSPSVRIHMLSLLPDKLPFKTLSVEQRCRVLNDGLTDEDDKVVNAAARLLKTWLDLYQQDLCALLEEMGVQFFCSSAETICQYCIKHPDMFTETTTHTSHTYTPSQLTPARLVYWRTLCEAYAHTERLDSLLPDPVDICTALSLHSQSSFMQKQLLLFLPLINLGDEAGIRALQKQLLYSISEWLSVCQKDEEEEADNEQLFVLQMKALRRLYGKEEHTWMNSIHTDIIAQLNTHTGLQNDTVSTLLQHRLLVLALSVFSNVSLSHPHSHLLLVEMKEHVILPCLANTAECSTAVRCLALQCLSSYALLDSQLSCQYVTIVVAAVLKETETEAVLAALQATLDMIILWEQAEHGLNSDEQQLLVQKLLSFTQRLSLSTHTPTSNPQEDQLARVALSGLCKLMLFDRLPSFSSDIMCWLLLLSLDQRVAHLPETQCIAVFLEAYRQIDNIKDNTQTHGKHRQLLMSSMLFTIKTIAYSTGEQKQHYPTINSIMNRCAALLQDTNDAEIHTTDQLTSHDHLALELLYYTQAFPLSKLTQAIAEILPTLNINTHNNTHKKHLLWLSTQTQTQTQTQRQGKDNNTDTTQQQQEREWGQMLEDKKAQIRAEDNEGEQWELQNEQAAEAAQSTTGVRGKKKLPAPVIEFVSSRGVRACMLAAKAALSVAAVSAIADSESDELSDESTDEHSEEDADALYREASEDSSGDDELIASSKGKENRSRASNGR